MIENLLWPKKMKEPPQLLVDVETLFKAKGNLSVKLVNFNSRSNIDREATCTLISVGTDGPDTFRIGFKVDVTQLTKGTYIMMALALPFQKISTNIIGFKCHGYTRADALLSMTPDETVEKTSLTNPPTITQYELGDVSGHKDLFKMESPEFEYDGHDKQFASGYGCYIDYDYENKQGDLKSESEFANMWTNYNKIVFETIIKVTVNRDYSSYNGFRLGVA